MLKIAKFLKLSCKIACLKYTFLLLFDKMIYILFCVSLIGILDEILINLILFLN